MKYTDEQIKNCVYNSYFDAHIPITESKQRANYVLVEQMRKDIREYQIYNRSGNNATYKDLKHLFEKCHCSIQQC